MKEREIITMPRSCVKLNEEEMELISGGLNIGMSRTYLNKSICISQGRGIVQTHNWKNVTAMQLAQEIYGHAVVYYKLAILGKIPVLDNLVYSHAANGVDLENAVDKYQAVWETIWNLS